MCFFTASTRVANFADPRVVSSLPLYFVPAVGIGDYGDDDDDSMTMGPIDFLFVANYIVNFEFLLDEVPELLSLPRACVVYGCKEGSEEAWRQACTTLDGSCSVDFLCRNPSDPPRSGSNPLAQRIPYGVHHTKMFLVGYSSGMLRVVVHTANLRFSDVHHKAQVCSPLRRCPLFLTGILLTHVRVLKRHNDGRALTCKISPERAKRIKMPPPPPQPPPVNLKKIWSITWNPTATIKSLRGAATIHREQLPLLP